MTLEFHVVEVETTADEYTALNLVVMDDWTCAMIVADYKEEIFNFYDCETPQNILPSWKGFEDPTLPCFHCDASGRTMKCNYFQLRIRDKGKDYVLCTYPVKANFV